MNFKLEKILVERNIDAEKAAQYIMQEAKKMAEGKYHSLDASIRFMRRSIWRLAVAEERKRILEYMHTMPLGDEEGIGMRVAALAVMEALENHFCGIAICKYCENETFTPIEKTIWVNRTTERHAFCSEQCGEYYQMGCEG